MAARKKARSKMTSLAEFRAWLEGVEEMQGDDWTPTREQWVKIRAKIDAIEDVEPEVVQAPVPPIPAAPAYAQPMHAPQGSTLDSVANNAHVPAPAAPIEMNPEAPIAKGQQQVKTPDIDTSTGEYKSAFE